MSSKYKYLSALIAFVLWGAWAYRINLGKGASSPLLYATVQGLFSFVMTIMMVKILEYFWLRMQQNRFANIGPVFLTVGLTGSVLISLHILIGTPRVFWTVLGPLVVSFIFCLFTVHQLQKQRN